MSDTQKNGFPYEIRKVDPEIEAEIKADLPEDQLQEEFIQVGPQKWLLPRPYEKVADIFYNFEFRTDDVVIATFPRSGTTVTQEMIWLLCNEFDYQIAAEKHLVERFPYIEYTSLFLNDNSTDAEEIIRWKKVANLTGQRFIKTHLPFSLLPPNLTKIGSKIIYIARNPKDVAVSYYYLERLSSVYDSPWNFKKFWNLFQRDLVHHCPYWEHVKDGWRLKDEENVMFMFYEDLRKDLRGTIEKIATFLGKSCTTEQLNELERHLTIDNFRKNKSVFPDFKKNNPIKENEGFIRKGKTGGWRDYFDEEMNNSADKWIEHNLKDTDLRFPL